MLYRLLFKRFETNLKMFMVIIFLRLILFLSQVFDVVDNSYYDVSDLTTQLVYSVNKFNKRSNYSFEFNNKLNFGF